MCYYFYLNLVSTFTNFVHQNCFFIIFFCICIFLSNIVKLIFCFFLLTGLFFNKLFFSLVGDVLFLFQRQFSICVCVCSNVIIIATAVAAEKQRYLS